MQESVSETALHGSKKNFRLRDSLGYLTNRAARAMTSDLNKNFLAEGLEITVEQWRVLVNLWDQDGLTQNELSERLLQEKSGVSRLIDGLEKRKLVVRVPDSLDRRNKRIHLSPLGMSLQDAFFTQADRTIGKAQEGIEEAELEMCRKVLRQIIENLT